MRILFVTSPAQGHFYPMVPLAWALRAAGHEVLVTAPESFHAQITGTGLPAARNGEPLDMIETMRPDPGDEPPRLAADKDVARAHTARGFAKLAAKSVDETVALVGAWRPDLVIAEPVAQAGPIAAARHGVPWVEHRWGLALPEQLLALLRENLAAQRAGAGVPDDVPPALVIDVCPPSFQYTDVPAGVAMRYLPYNGPAVLADWMLNRADKPRVCVTLGTVLPRYGRVEGLFEVLLDAVAGTDAALVVALDEEDRARLQQIERLPASVRTATWLPLNLVLPVCDAIVHHGGSGTTMTSLVNGLPQVAVPHFADQFANADQIDAHGVGVRIAPDQLSPDAVRAAVRAVLDEATYRRAAQSIAAEVAKQPNPAELVALVEQVARDRS